MIRKNIIKNKNDKQRYFLNDSWRIEMPAVVRTPFYGNNCSEYFGYVVTYSEMEQAYHLLKVDLHNGKILWSIDAVNGGYGTPTVFGDLVVFLKEFDAVQAVSAESGIVEWAVQGGHRVRTTLNVIDETLWFGSGSTLLAVNKNGEVVKKLHIPNSFIYGNITPYKGGILCTGTLHNNERDCSCSYLYSILPYTLPKIFSGSGGLHVNPFFMVLSILSFLVVPILNYPNNLAMQSVRKYSKQVLFDDLVKKKYMYFDDMETGKIQDLFSESSFCTRSLLYSCVQFIIKHSAIIIINSTAFFNFHFLLGVTYILSYSVYFFISIVLLKKQNNRIHSTLLSASDVNSYLIDYCQNLDSIYSFRSYDKEKEKYRFLLDSEQKNYYGLQLAIDNAKLIQHIVLVFITFLQLIIFSIYSTTGIGNISFYLGLIYSIFNLRDFGGEYLSMIEMVSRLKAALKLLGYSESNEKDCHRVFISVPTNTVIAMQNVELTLGNKKIFDNASLYVNKGEHIIIRGENGSGKSTLLKVIAKILDIDSGQITYGLPSIDGIMYVSQNTNLFNRSIYENIIYPMDDANLEEVYELINIFGLNSLITSENDLFQKKPGDFGNKFSGGEKQKILIIRTLINRPHIILFDEITSSLDSNSTKVFYEMLNTRLSSSTVLFVSHDDVVDSAFDRVLEIDELHAL